MGLPVSEYTRLNGENEEPDGKWFSWRRSVIRTIILSVLLCSISLIVVSQFFGGNRQFPPDGGKKNVVFFVTDGMGPASLAMTRAYKQYVNNQSFSDILVLDNFLIGSSRTLSSSSLITDSAAGATAFSCGMKSYNGAIGVDSDKRPCGTILEAAKLDGYMTGLVVTTRVTDATPAAFSSHADYRWYESLIAEHQLGYYPLGRMVDLIIGGGRTYFYPTGQTKHGRKGSRTDNRDLIDEAISDGWSYVDDVIGFEQLQLGENVTLPLLALLADFDIPFDLDRKDTEYPSLENEAITAIKALAKATEDSDKGFFLMIEGSRIDHAGHMNDPAAQVNEVLAFDKAFKAVVDYVDTLSTETVIISTSDHETGGLAVARQVSKDYPDYAWFPEVLSKVKHSGKYLASTILDFYQLNVEPSARKDFLIDVVLKEALNIHDFTDADIEELLQMHSGSEIKKKLNNLVSVRAQLGWSTHGHSAVDVNIYAHSNNPLAKSRILDELSGNRENTDIGQFMARYMDLDLDTVTNLLRDMEHAPPKKEIILLEGASESDLYHPSSVKSG